METENAAWQKPLDLEFIQRKPRVEGERVFAITTFADITKFQEWTNHPFTSPEKHANFMVQLYEEFLRFRNGSGYFVKLLADGLMAVKEVVVGADKSRLALEMLIHSWQLIDAVENLRGRSPYPLPGKLRIRHTAGDVLKLEATDAADSAKKQIDYTGYAITLPYVLLGIEKDIPCIGHASFLELMDLKQLDSLGIAVSHVPEPDFCPEEIHPKDLKVLSSFGRPPRDGGPDRFPPRPSV